MSLFFIEAVNADSYYAASTFSFSGSFDSWAKCGKTGYGSNTAGNYMYKSITPASGGGMYDVYVYADMDNNLCTSCDFYVDGVDVWPTVSLYAASSSCEARLLGSIPLSSSAHEFRFDRSTDAGNWVELVHLTVNYASGETCGAGQYAYGGSCTNVGAGYYSPASDNDRYACAAGYYCSTATNSASTGNGQCSAGYYGSSTGQTAATCNGQCTAGYYCTAGSTSATQNVCGTGKYCPTGSSGATNCVAGYYGSSTTNSVSTCNGACTAGYYCTAGSTSATQNACTNKPLNSNYNSTSGTNSCGFSCAGDLESKFGCATAGNNTNIHFLNNVSSYSNLTLKVGSKIYLNNSNLTISQLILDGSGDKIIINSGSQLIINGSN